jgi:hypothetical protein
MMMSMQEKAQSIISLAKSKSTATVQHNFHRTHEGDLPVSAVI